jgi:5-methyltetrahydrofolate--homocysteine methyltransferase
MGALRELLGPAVRIADGGVGTGLQASSLEAGQAPEELALDAPDELVALHRSFIRAGSDILLTDTFGANSVRLRHSAHRDVERVNRAAVACARRAIELEGRRDVLVAGSIGPTGELLAPLGELDPEIAEDAFAEQASALGGCDLLVVETMFALDEASAALRGCRRTTGLPVVVSFSFDSGQAQPRTMMGHTVEDVVVEMAELGADGIGFNCGTSLEIARATAAEFVAAIQAHGVELPLWVKPNAGIPEPLSGCYPAQPDDMASFAAWAAELGAAVVGGCCGTTGEHLHEIASALR